MKVITNRNRNCLDKFKDIDSKKPTLIKCTVKDLTEFAYKDGKRIISGRGEFNSLSAFAGSVYKRKLPDFKEKIYKKGVNGWNHCEILKNGTWVKASELR